jgi:hypothetical protein
MKTTILIFLASLVLFAVSSCSKEETPEPTAELKFMKLISEREDIYSGESTEITAEASGTNLSYKWSASGGRFWAVEARLHTLLVVAVMEAIL